MKETKIVVIYAGDDWEKETPFASEFTRKSFEDWHIRGVKRGILFFRASISWYDLREKVFTKSWAFRDGKWIKINEPIKPDLIFDKVAGVKDYDLFGMKEKIAKDVPIFNHPLFRTMYNSKLSQALIFKKYMAKTELALDEKDYKKRTKKIPGDKLVIKPIYGSGGNGIVIDDRKNIDPGFLEYPCIIQEFIESNVGIPGFSEKEEVADLRMVFINHKLIYALSRIAKQGSLFTNFHQGATAVLVPENKIPENAYKMAKKIIKQLSVFSHAHYSLDFIFKNNGDPMLVEMNTTPGFDLLYFLGNKQVVDDNFIKFIKTADAIIKSYNKIKAK